MEKKVIIYGTGNMAKLLYSDYVLNPSFEIACFIAEEKYIPESEKMFGYPVFSCEKVIEVFPKETCDILVADGRTSKMKGRVDTFERVKALGYKITNHVNPTANIEPGIIMGENNLIFAQAHLGFDGKLGSNNIIRQQAYIGHEFTIGDYNTFRPGCRVASRCEIEDYCHFGLGSVMIEETRVAEGTYIGAGAVVIRDTEPYTTNVGNPSRVIKRFSKEEFMTGNYNE